MDETKIMAYKVNDLVSTKYFQTKNIQKMKLYVIKNNATVREKRKKNYILKSSCLVYRKAKIKQKNYGKRTKRQPKNLENKLKMKQRNTIISVVNFPCEQSFEKMRLNLTNLTMETSWSAILIQCFFECM